MRIKRFIATDMRTALRMVREEQGADAVILSSRPTADGIEVVAATDYDEALVHQALRAAAPGLPAAAQEAATPGFAAPARPALAAGAVPAAAVFQPAASAPATSSAPATAPAPSFASRARAVFRIGDAPAAGKAGRPAVDATLAELTGAASPAAGPVSAHAADHAGADRATAGHAAASMPTAAAAPLASPASAPVPSHFEAMMAALIEPAPAAPPAPANALSGYAAAPAAPATTPAAVPPVEAPVAAVIPAAAHASGAASAADSADRQLRDIGEPAEAAAPSALAAAPRHAAATEMADPSAAHAGAVDPAPAAATPALQAVAEPDPGISAMREELTSMRRMIEREMGQFTAERLRGSPARAAAYDMLLGYGCDEALAQTIAGKLNPALAPDKVRAPMLAELARMLTITRSEPIDDGGVIALIGPTGAGKTTTVAKLAARFAARHRARDVAMVTTDSERVGAIEQLHAHGRRLGITVCEAHGAESLAQTLDQLQDYPLVLVDTAGYGARDRALLGQITWLRATRQLRSLLVLPANAHPHDLNELVRRYRMASPEGVVLSKTDETGRLGAALSVAVRNGLSLAYTAHGQQVPGDLEAADASRLVLQLEKLRRAADNPFVTEDHHAVA